MKVLLSQRNVTPMYITHTHPLHIYIREHTNSQETSDYTGGRKNIRNIHGDVVQRHHIFDIKTCTQTELVIIEDYQSIDKMSE